MHWIDTHAHLDAAEFGGDRDAMLERCTAAGVGCVVIPAVAPHNFDAVRELAARSGHAYALGVHPLYVAQAGGEAGLRTLRRALETARDDPRLVAVGEIGLDFFVPGFDAELQQWWYVQQLKLARELALPVLLHVRRSQDQLLAGLRRCGWGQSGAGGIAHAFNGSRQQAEAFVALGFKLGFGGAMTFERARNIRRLAATLPEQALVLETDAPDIAPAWLAGSGVANEPAQLPRIAETLAALRAWSLEHTAALTCSNARAALPRLAAWLDARPA